MDESLRPAKITDRFLAFLIDSLPFVVGFYASLYILIVRLGRLPNTPGVWKQAGLLWLGAYLAYQTLGNARGATVGKALLGISVVGRDGAPLGLPRGLLRALGYLLSMPLGNLGFLWSFVDRHSRAWHDLLAGSRVVETSPKSSAAALGSAALAFSALAALALANVWALFSAPTPKDLEAIEKARQGLRVLAAIEEVHKIEHGAYTESLLRLASASGDVAQFREAMQGIFDPDGFVFRADKERYELRGRAKDRRRTIVRLSGPPPKIEK